MDELQINEWKMNEGQITDKSNGSSNQTELMRYSIQWFWEIIYNIIYRFPRIKTINTQFSLSIKIEAVLRSHNNAKMNSQMNEQVIDWLSGKVDEYYNVEWTNNVWEMIEWLNELMNKLMKDYIIHYTIHLPDSHSIYFLQNLISVN